MTRLSDLLRGAANRAPIGEASVSLEKAHRRVRVHRGARGAANGLLGAGAAALIVVGIVHPALTPGKDGADGLSSAPSGGIDRVTGPSPEADYWYYQWGTCGSYLESGYPGPDESLTLAVESGDWDGLEGGSTLDIPVRLLAMGDLTVRTTGAEAALLWEGMVVARLDSYQAEEILDVASGDAIDSTLSFPLVNCFDGATLPATKYELVVSQGYSYEKAEIEPAPEPTLLPEPAPEPSLPPEPELAPEPSLEDATARDGAGVSSDTIDPGIDIMPPIEPTPWDYRETAASVTVSIAGEVVEDPFADYIWSPPAKPDDLITPEKARELYEAALVSGVWDMAPGTSRWILPNYNYDVYDETGLSSSRIAPSGWFGCSWDGTNGVAFPTQSADLDLLDVSVSFPSRINVSYGWVVDGNPQVRFAVENTSDFSLPGFYGEPSHALYLVKDGRVVAEAWPQNTRPYSGGVAYEIDSSVSPDQYWGTLTSGATLTGDYLWRDLNGCWTESGPRPVSDGTYTLLTAQTLYIENSTGGGHPVPYWDGDGLVVYTDDQPVDAGPRPEPVEDAPATDPGLSSTRDPYFTYDWVEFQVWTSLGTVTITTT